MKKTEEFDNILDECLQRLLDGDSIEQCLADYPAFAYELSPLLHTAMEAKMAASVQPRPEFRERARYQFQQALRDIDFKPERSRGRMAFAWPRWATAVAVFVAMVVALGGTSFASAGSLPDDTLYGVKRATESVRMAFTFTDLGKAELYVRLADERVNEIIRMADEGKLEHVEETTDLLNEQLIAMSNLGDWEKGAPAEEEAAMLGAEEPRMMTATDERSQAASVPAPAPLPAKTIPTTTPVPGEGPAEHDTETDEVPPPEVIVKEVPAPTIMVPAAAEVSPPMPPAPGGANDILRSYGLDSNDFDVDDWESLKELLSRHAASNTQALWELLEKVPEELRSALLEAIQVAGEGYDNALRNLD